MSQEDDYKKQLETERINNFKENSINQPAHEKTSQTKINDYATRQPNLNIPNKEISGDENYHAKRLENARKENNGNFIKAAKSFKNVSSGPKWKAPIEAVKLGLALRKSADDHEASPWIIAFTIAIACDCADEIPVAGWIITLFFRPFLFIFLWGKGTWKLKMTYYILLLLDFIPILNILPLSTACVIYAFMKSKEKAAFAKKLLGELHSEANYQNIKNAFPSEN